MPDVDIADVAPVLVPAVEAPHHPDRRERVGGAPVTRLPDEFLSVSIRVTNYASLTPFF